MRSAPLHVTLWSEPTSMVTEADVRDALRVCFDPELPLNIVDIGLVYAIHVEQDLDAPGSEPRFEVRVELLRRTTDETREAMLLAQVENRLMGLPAISKASASVLASPPWTSDRLKTGARESLVQSPTPSLVQIRL